MSKIGLEWVFSSETKSVDDEVDDGPEDDDEHKCRDTIQGQTLRFLSTFLIAAAEDEIAHRVPEEGDERNCEQETNDRATKKARSAIDESDYSIAGECNYRNESKC